MSLPGPLPPRQARSRAVLERLLAAAEAAIAERGTADLTVHQVAERAGVAAGTLYTRFRNKDALLRALAMASFERARRTADALLEDPRWRTLPPVERVHALVRMMVKSYRAKRGLLRAVHLYLRTHPDPAFQREAAARAHDLATRLIRLLRHDEAAAAGERAALVGFLVVDAAARETILFAEPPPSGAGPSDDELIALLSDLYCRQLGLESPVSQPR